MKLIKTTFLNKPISIQITGFGDDLSILIQGGDTPHIGAVSLGVPYTKSHSKKTYVSASNISLPGHQDAVITDLIAKKTATALNKTVAVIGGIHYESISIEEIEALIRHVDTLIFKSFSREMS